MSKKAFRILMVLILTVCVSFSQPIAVLAADTNSGQEINLDYLKSVIDMIKEKYKGEVNEKQLLEGALKGMFNTMDPYTTFYTPDEANSTLNSLDGTYEGVGVSIDKDGDYIVVTDVVPDSPAFRAGVLENDRIVIIDNKNAVGISTDEAVSLMRGKAGTTVNLVIMRNGISDIIKMSVVREEIKVNPVTYETKGDIGYIKIDSFNSSTYKYTKQACDEFDKKGISKVILDLRGNPGGEVGQAVSVAKLFVPKGLITKLDYKSEGYEDEEYYSDLDSPKYKLAVLVNDMTASASEILSGAIQDTGAGMLIGTKTFGKAKVQIFIPILTPEAYEKYESQLGVKLTDASDLYYNYGVNPTKDEIIGWSKMTVALYTTPKGRMIDGVGLTPDIAVDNMEPVKGVPLNSIQKLPKKAKPTLNSNGRDVLYAKAILKMLGYDVDIDGTKLDERTFRAIAKFQKDSGLFSYGTLDYTTQQLLNDKLDKLILDTDKQYVKAVEVLSK